MPRPKLLPFLVLAIISLIWGLNFVIIKVAYRYFSPESLGLIRYVAMIPLMYLVAHITKQKANIPPRQRWRFWKAGLLGSGVYMVLFLEGMDRVSPGVGAVILATAPIWIGLFSILAKHEAFRWRLLVGTLVGYLGVVMVILGRMSTGSSSWLGIGLVAVSALVWAWSVIEMKPLLDEQPAIGMFASSLPAAGLVLIPYGIADTLRIDWLAVPLTGWLSLGYLVVLAGVLCFVLYYYGVQTIGSSKTARIGYFVPLVANLGGWLILDEAMTLVQFAGVGVVLVGMYLAGDTIKIRRPGRMVDLEGSEGVSVTPVVATDLTPLP